MNRDIHILGSKISKFIFLIIPGNYRNQSIKFRNEFQIRTFRIRELAKTYIQGTNKEVWMTDPADYHSKFVQQKQTILLT